MENNPNRIPTPGAAPMPQQPYYSPVPQQPYNAAVPQPAQQQPIQKQAAPAPFVPAQPQSFSSAPVSPVAPAPSPFGPPPAPIGSSPGGSYSPKKGPGKGLIIGLVGGLIGLILLVGGGFLLVTMLFVVSKSDYQTAYDSASDLRSSYSKLNSTYLSSSSTETEIKNEVDTYKKASKDFDANYEKLSELKAVKADSDVAAAFKKLATKKEKFDEARSVELEAYETVIPAVVRFTSSTSSSSSAKITQWRTDMEAVTGLKYQVNKDFVATMIDQLKTLETYTVKVEAGRADYRKYDSSAVTAFYDTYDKLTTTMRDWGSNIDKLKDDGDVADEINDVGEVITKKLNAK